MQHRIELHYLRIDRKIIRILLDGEKYQLISHCLKLRRDDVALFCYIHGKGYQCRRYVDLVEASGHGILSSDGRQPEADLCIVRAKQCGKRLAPALRLLAHSAEILLEGKAHLAVIAAGSHDSRQRLKHCIDRTVIRAPGRQIRIETVRHHRDRIGFAGHHRNLCHHGLCLGQLIFPAERHVYASRSDGTVEHLHQSLLRTHIQVSKFCEPCFLHIACC